MLSASIYDMPIIALNWVAAMAPISITACSVCRDFKCSNILYEIESRDIGHQNQVNVRSQFRLGIMTHVACFQFFRKWFCSKEALKSWRSS